MDELAALIDKLTGEVAALEAAVDGRRAEEEQLLTRQEARLKVASERSAAARALLRADGDALAVLDKRRGELLKRIDSWRGELWRIGYSGAVMALVTTALVPIAALTSWMGSSFALAMVGTQVLVFGIVFFSIPEKR